MIAEVLDHRSSPVLVVHIGSIEGDLVRLWKPKPAQRFSLAKLVQKQTSSGLPGVHLKALDHDGGLAREKCFSIAARRIFCRRASPTHSRIAAPWDRGSAFDRSSLLFVQKRRKPRHQLWCATTHWHTFVFHRYPGLFSLFVLTRKVLPRLALFFPGAT